ncbi:MAG: MBL fold metallo-hydrolase [Candidatus Heimdallarchaeaceae archaeon]
MKEFNGVAVFDFRIIRGKYQIYLVKRGKDFPKYPSTWTAIASIISSKDVELFNKLQEKYGEITENLLEKITVLRLLLERNLVVDPEIQSSIPLTTDNYQRILQMDSVYLSILFQSMIPCGSQDVLFDNALVKSKYYLSFSSAAKFYQSGNLSQSSIYFKDRKQFMEEKGHWFKTSKAIKKYASLKETFSSSCMTFISMLHEEKKKIFEIAGYLENQTSQLAYSKKGFLPNIWKFVTPAPTRTPFNKCNIYVVGNERQYIIDPGSTTVKAIVSLEKYIEENIDKIDGFLLTNHFVDHCNQALRLKEEYDIPLYASEKTAEKLYDKGFFFNSYLNEGVKIYLGSYEPLRIKKWELTVIDLPGYSEGHLGFYDPRGVLFSGSLIHKGVVSLIGNYDGAYTDYLNSLKKVSKLKPKYILSGHRYIISNVKEAINFNLMNFEQHENIILSIIKDGKTSLDEIINFIFEKSNLEWRDSAANIARFNLAKLQELEKIRKCGDDFVLV